MSDFLAKYHPQTASIFKQFAVDESLPDEERAFSTWRALVTAKKSYEALFLVIGKLLKDIRDQELFTFLDYENFTQFLNSEEIGFSREKAYMCIRVFEYYIEYLQLKPEKVGEMNISRLSMMIPMLKKIKDKDEQIEQVEELSQLRHNDFVREVKKNTNREGRPDVYFSEEHGKWVVSYYEDVTIVHSLGTLE